MLLSASERFRNALLGLSILSWAGLGIVGAEPEARFTVVRWCISALNLCVGLLILLRRPAAREGSAAAIAVSLPSLVIGGWALHAAPPLAAWPAYAAALFTAATLWTIVAFLNLGGSFAILPAVRSIVVGGPFRWMRHPAYCGEMLLALACWSARPSLLSIAPFLTGVPLIVARIMAEERLLMSSAAYRSYARRVKWRLVPFIW